MKPLFSVLLGRKVVEVLSVRAFYCLLLFYFLLGVCWGVNQGQIERTLDAAWKETEYRYDALNRITARIPDAEVGGTPIEFTYTESGQRKTMSDASGVTEYRYDARDRLAEKETPQGILTYTYDGQGNVTSISSSNANGATVLYRYDDLNRLSEVEEGASEISRYGYDEVGNLEHFATANGVRHGYTYNSLDRLTHMMVTSSHPGYSQQSGAVAAFTYAQGRAGHRTRATDLSGRVASYRYDSLYRLDRETISSDPAGRNGTVGYAYDSVGNRLARNSSIGGLSSSAWAYDLNDRLASDVYDANGNTRGGKVALNAAGAERPPVTVTDGYDFEDRLTERTGPTGAVQIVYDGDGNKVREVTSENGLTTAISYLVDTLNPTGYAQVLEELQNGTVVRTYTYGHDLLLQDQRDGGGTWSANWYVYDGHGNVRGLTDASGALSDTYDYDAFGTLLSAQGTTFNRYRYCGEQFDSALGLYYLRARLMNPHSGRFWTADRYEGSPSDPGSLHKYRYANSEPVVNVDPSGYVSLTELQASSRERQSGSQRAQTNLVKAYRLVRGNLCIVAAGTLLNAHHVLPVFVGAKRHTPVNDSNKVSIPQSFHKDLHRLLNIVLQLAGQPPQNAGKRVFEELLKDTVNKQAVLRALRFTYRIYDRKCAIQRPPPLSPVLEQQIRNGEWEFLYD